LGATGAAGDSLEARRVSYPFSRNAVDFFRGNPKAAAYSNRPNRFGVNQALQGGHTVNAQQFRGSSFRKQTTRTETLTRAAQFGHERRLQFLEIH
jgi:hypothetical protein